jgi:SAM-dependent methyltransferase
MTDDAENLRAFERDAHDRVAPHYDAFFAPVTALVIAPLLDAADIAPGMRVLDVARGPGHVAAAAAERGATPTGVDIAPGMVAHATRRHPGIAFRVAEVESLPFPDAGFDGVVCNFGLGHFPHPKAAVAECLRVLRPGGALAFAWWDDPARQRFQAIFRGAIDEVGAQPPLALAGHSTLHFCDPDEFRRLLEGAGLAGVTIRAHATTHRVPDAEALWQGGLKGLALTGSTIAWQTKAVQARIRAAFDRLVEGYRDAEGLLIPIAFLIGSGRKPD